MSVQHPFAGFNPRPSPWGYNWTTEEVTQAPTPQAVSNHRRSPEPRPTSGGSTDATQFANLPAALLGNLKRDKKPFTYTPGGVNLSEVLESRLKKRLERKKRYMDDEVVRSASPKEVIVLPTYNSPLDMYSMQNALEMLEVQSELATADKNSFSRPSTLPRNHTFRFDDDPNRDMDPGRGVAQSKAFRVLQIMTDTEEDPTVRQRPHPPQEEMRFTGIRENKASIPSKFFHTLQKITGTDDDNNNMDADEQQQYVQQPRNAAVPAGNVVRPSERLAERPLSAPQQQHHQLQQYQQQQHQQQQYQQQQHQQQQQQYQQQQYQQEQQQHHQQQQQQKQYQQQQHQQQQYQQQQLYQQLQQYQHSPSASTLKRPSAFLQAKTSEAGPGFRPVKPFACANGSVPNKRQSHPTAATDF